MAIKLKVDCTSSNCRFKDKCILINPIKVLDPQDCGGDFAPILKIRLIKRDLQLRCFSFSEGGRYEE